MSAETKNAKDRLPLALWALAVCTFGIGTGEFVVAGLLLEVARDLRISTDAAGLLVTAYALGVIAGAPLVGGLLRRLPRKRSLLALMGLFTLGNMLCALAPNYPTLMAARVVTGLAHATFLGMGSVIAAELSPPGHQASAIAVMFTGVTLANVVGVPLGTFLGQSQGWRATFCAVALLNLLAAASVGLLVPRLPRPQAVSLGRELRVIRRPEVLLAFATTVLGNGSVVLVFTYIAPILVKIAGFNEKAVGPILLLFGLGFVVGNALGGKLADRALMPSLLGTLAALAAVLAGFTLTSHGRIAAAVTVFLFGVTAFGMVPCLQLRVVRTAEGAPNLASIFNIAAFNVGSAGGAYLGGMVLRSSLGLGAVPWVGASVTAASLAVALIGWTTDRAAKPADQASG